MEATSSCLRLLSAAVFLLALHGLHVCASKDHFRIILSRLQFFEYEPVYFTCLGFNVSNGLRVRHFKQEVSDCWNITGPSTITCVIDYALVSDSGEYWCEGGGGERSNTVEITVTGGSVILESPVLPVMEGNNVTLRCRKKSTSNETADFYKDGHFIGRSVTGNMTIESVSSSDEGLYKCNISGAGESPEGWMVVRDTNFHIVPSRQQLFEYESVSFTCQGFDTSNRWIVRNIKQIIPGCFSGPVPLTVTCTIKHAVLADSGEYWCEGGGGKRSNTVNIIVTAGSVILESPVLPVMEGEAVTLLCRYNKTSSKQTAYFYKDGLLFGSSVTGNMTIESVSSSDEGLYKCNISGAGESPENQLTVRVLYKETIESSDHSGDVVYVMRAVIIILLLALQVLVVGLLHYGKLTFIFSF